jgi:hypothetical protein
MISKRLVLFVALAGVSLGTQAGIVIEYVNRNATTGKEEPLQTMWIQSGLARMESNAARMGTVATIFKNESMYVIDDGTKSYRVMDKASIDQMAGTLNDAMAKMREQMAKMPPEQRAMMEQMMKQQGVGGMMNSGPQKPVTYDAQAAGGTETVNGKSCKLWNVTRDGALTQQLCVVPVSAMPGAQEVLELSKKMAAMFEKFGQQMRDQMPEIQQSGAALAKIDGYPIMTRTYREGVLQPEQFVVKSWKQQAIDAGKFEIPAGYKKQEMPKMK